MRAQSFQRIIARRAHVLWLVALLVAQLLVACVQGDRGGRTTSGSTGRASSAVSPFAATIVSIAITPATASVPEGLTSRFVATATFDDDTTADVSSIVAWTVDDPTVATVSATGVATGVAPGVVTVTATDAATASTDSATLTVTDPALLSIAVAPSTPIILVGGTIGFTATGWYSDGSSADLTGTVVWSAGSTAIATVDATGIATGVGVGMTPITARDPSGVAASTALIVADDTIRSITVAPSTASIAEGATQAFTATGTFADGSTADVTADVTWTSADTTVATVATAAANAGTATGVKQGVVTITARVDTSGVSGSSTLTVTCASTTTLTDCGVCGRACSVSHGTATCATGACRVASCNDGYVASSSGTVCRRPNPIANADFSDGLTGWVVDGSCSGETSVTTDDAVHGKALALSLGGGTGCTSTKVWQAAAVDVGAAASVRIRLDAKMMQYYSYTGAVNLRVFAGTAPTYDTTLIGNHVFRPGALSESTALAGTTTLPLGTWYAFTTDDLKPLLPAGTRFLRVEMWVAGGGVYGWARIDNVKVVLNDSTVAKGAASVAAGAGPTSFAFNGTCAVGTCATQAWDFGDGSVDVYSTSGGGSSTLASPTYSYPARADSRTYNVGYTVEDGQEGARTVITTVTVTHLPPTAAILASPAVGPAPLATALTGQATAPSGTIASYAWTFGDGSTSSLANPSHTFADAGSYLVTLTVTDNAGATATARTTIIATGAARIANGDFAAGLRGWVVEGNCAGESRTLTDDALHSSTLGLYLGGGTSCTPTKIWQVAPVDAVVAGSVRVRLDAKMMQYYSYSGAVNVRVFAGSAPSYDQTLVGNHVFQPGAFSDATALAATTSAPLGTWTSYTSDDLKPLLPRGTKFLRVELWIRGGGVYGWSRIDNVKVLVDDASVPRPTSTATPSTGAAPLTVQFNGGCASGTCATQHWDFGDGTVDFNTPGGGGTSSLVSPKYVYDPSGGSGRSFIASYTVEDASGGARTAVSTISVTHLPPTVSITATPPAGASPLNVSFTANTTAPSGTIVSYQWGFGDGGTSTLASPTHSYASTGTYNVFVTVTDSGGASATARHAVIVTGPQKIANGDFSAGLSGWVVEGNCSGETRAISDDAVHAGTLGLYLGGGTSCTPTKVWQVAPVDVSTAASVRVRLDAKMMQYYSYSGAVNLRVYAGSAPSYDQTLVGNHVFRPGAFVDSSALVGTSTSPLGTWTSYTSDDLKPLIPAGAKFLRVELWVQGGGVYGWARIDNVKLILGDPTMPTPSATATPSSGPAPLNVTFNGGCGTGPCVSQSWDFGDGTVDFGAVGGGSTSTVRSPSFTFPARSASRTYNVSFTIEDTAGAARTVVTSVTATRAPPTASISASPGTGTAPLTVQLSAIATAPSGSIVAYAWTFGDGGTASTPSATHTYTAAGSYSVRLTVTDDGGATATATYTVVVR